MISLVVASERERAQTTHVAMHVWCCRTTTLYESDDQNILERITVDGESPVGEVIISIVES